MDILINDDDILLRQKVNLQNILTPLYYLKYFLTRKNFFLYNIKVNFTMIF